MAKRESKGGGGILSAGRGDEAAREYLITATSELVEHLLFIRNHKNDPGLSAINNQRRRYARILFAMDGYFHKIGHDKVHELGTYIASLGVALQDLIEGVTDPLFVTKGSKRDSMRIWGARLQAALSLECLIRGTNRDLKGSSLSWYDRYVEGRVPVPPLVEAFQTKRREIKAANLSPVEYRRRGKQAFEQAVKSATR